MRRKSLVFTIVLVVATIATLLCCLCLAGGFTWVARVPSDSTSERPAPPAATLVLVPTSTPPPTPDPETSERHIRILTELWHIVYEGYLYPDYNGVDWEAVGNHYYSHVSQGLSDEDFWMTMYEMVTMLDDDHSTFLPPYAVTQEDETFSGDMTYVGIGVYAAPRLPKSYSVILAVFPDSPAEQVGLRAHDRILKVDHHPACCRDDGSDYLYRLYGPVGTPVELIVQTPGHRARTVTLTRRRIQGTLPVETRQLERNVGYISIPTFWDKTIVRRVRQALQDLTEQQELDGLLLDLRINSGGSDIVMEEVLAFFTHGAGDTLGRYVNRWGSIPLEIEGEDVGGSQRVPLVVLVSEETASFAEIFSGILQETERAQIVGNTTAGNVEITYGYDFEDGSRAWIAQETFRTTSGADWEETGIVPDVEIPIEWDEFTVEDDPQIDAALDLLAP
ncbi:MAG TPA: PDZ domain-containing protein [Chloroflexi bacterium]|nr:PDZ domain-containing protein [Chloroflexota bacterium]